MTPDPTHAPDIPTESEAALAAARFARRPSAIDDDTCPCRICATRRREEALTLREGRAVDTRAAVVLETAWQVP